MAALAADGAEVEPPQAPPPHSMTFRGRDSLVTLQPVFRGNLDRQQLVWPYNRSLRELKQAIANTLTTFRGSAEAVRLVCGGKVLVHDALALGPMLEGKVVQYQQALMDSPQPRAPTIGARSAPRCRFAVSHGLCPRPPALRGTDTE